MSHGHWFCPALKLYSQPNEESFANHLALRTLNHLRSGKIDKKLLVTANEIVAGDLTEKYNIL